MAYLKYTATREIIGGHSYGAQYSIVFTAQQQDIPRSVDSIVRRSLSGKHVSTLRHYDKKWVIRTDYIHSSVLTSAGWHELIASTVNGETIIYDPDSSVPGTPVNPRNCFVEGSVSPTREGDSPYFSVTFTLVETGYAYV